MRPSSPDVPVRVSCACPLLLRLLLLPPPDSFSSCPLFPPSLLLRVFSLPFLASAASSPSCSPGRGRSSPWPLSLGCVASPGVLVRVPACVCPLFLPLLPLLPPGSCPSSLSSLSTTPCSCLFLPPPLPPPYAAPAAPIRIYPRRSSPGPPSSGCPSRCAFLPRMFQSGFHVLIRLSFFSFFSLIPPLVLVVLSLHCSWLLLMLSLPVLTAAASSSQSPGLSNSGLPRPRMFLSGCVPSPFVPVRVPCVWSPLLHLLLIPLPGSCSSRLSSSAACPH